MIDGSACVTVNQQVRTAQDDDSARCKLKPSGSLYTDGSMSCVSDDSGISLANSQLNRVSDRPDALACDTAPAGATTAVELILPPGWQQCVDDAGEAYFWHVPSGRTQREPPRSAQLRAVPAEAVRRSNLIVAKDCVSNQRTRSSEPQSHQIESRRDSSDKNQHQSLLNEAAVQCERFDVVPLGVRIAEEQQLVDSPSLRNWLLETITYFERYPTQQSSAKICSSTKFDEVKCSLDITSDTVQLRSVADARTLQSRPLRCIRLWATLDRFVAYVTFERDYHSEYRRPEKPANLCYVVRAANAYDAVRIAEGFRRRSRQLTASGLQPNDVCSMKPTRREAEIGTQARPAINNEHARIESLVEAHIAEFEAEEPVRVIPCFYVGRCSTNRATGVDTLNSAISIVCDTTLYEQYTAAYLLISPSEFRLRRAVGSAFDSTVHNNADQHTNPAADGELIIRCPLRFLSFFGVAADNVRLCGLMVRQLCTAVCRSPVKTNADQASQTGQHECYVIYCEPDAGQLCQLLQAACTLRFQKALDAACFRKHLSGEVKTQHLNSEKVFSRSVSDESGSSRPPADNNAQSSLQTLVTSLSLFKRFSSKPEHR